ncbi:hypothetical protein ABIE58_000346 [Roseovarius sp. MBR-78]|jgi:hypothetical protein
MLRKDDPARHAVQCGAVGVVKGLLLPFVETAHRRAAVRRSNVSLGALYLAKSEKPQRIAQVAAKSPCRGAARRCAAARSAPRFRAGNKP